MLVQLAVTATHCIAALGTRPPLCAARGAIRRGSDLQNHQPYHVSRHKTHAQNTSEWEVRRDACELHSPVFTLLTTRQKHARPLASLLSEKPGAHQNTSPRNVPAFSHPNEAFRTGERHSSRPERPLPPPPVRASELSLSRCLVGASKVAQGRQHHGHWGGPVAAPNKSIGDKDATDDSIAAAFMEFSRLQHTKATYAYM